MIIIDCQSKDKVIQRYYATFLLNRVWKKKRTNHRKNIYLHRWRQPYAHNLWMPILYCTIYCCEYDSSTFTFYVCVCLSYKIHGPAWMNDLKIWNNSSGNSSSNNNNKCKNKFSFRLVNQANHKNVNETSGGEVEIDDEMS